MLTATVARAQITIAEPKFEQEATIVMNDTAGVELQLEYAIQKRTENVGTFYLARATRACITRFRARNRL